MPLVERRLQGVSRTRQGRVRVVRVPPAEGRLQRLEPLRRAAHVAAGQLERLAAHFLLEALRAEQQQLLASVELRPQLRLPCAAAATPPSRRLARRSAPVAARRQPRLARKQRLLQPTRLVRRTARERRRRDGGGKEEAQPAVVEQLRCGGLAAPVEQRVEQLEAAAVQQLDEGARVRRLRCSRGR